jgi:RNA methyltransferase, TrmH family
MPVRVLKITSTRNPLVQSIRKAAGSGKPTDDGLLVVEGPHLVDELLDSPWSVEKLLLTPEAFPLWEERLRELDVETLLVPARTFSVMAATENTQGVMALARARSWSWDELLGSQALLVALDAIQDPGNAGAIVRSAEAFGASGVVFLERSVRLSNPKLIRASAGSLFRVPLREQVATGEFASKAREYGCGLLALVVSGPASLHCVSFEGPCAIILGSEGAGVSPELLAASTSVTIRTSRVESLNAAVACSIALYEADRQRRDLQSV